ncbi:type II toxin-antitoxin system ParD family antitoxin [Sphingomonas sp.]|uniref:type II toxin-antitoxin system ParD family antitoxin n=1 Tax=Sphingomonas sp. TaxID=28214 RepID=UPI0025D1D13B|nr:type II toxin-antitoxin system ParD family antitoxin [Sphingomonas sp.]
MESGNAPQHVGDDRRSLHQLHQRAGRYGSASDVVRAGLRLLEELEAKVTTLRDALIAGEQSGEPRPFDFEAFKARKRAGYEGR